MAKGSFYKSADSCTWRKYVGWLKCVGILVPDNKMSKQVLNDPYCKTANTNNRNSASLVGVNSSPQGWCTKRPIAK